jgi:hypothetical protein
VQASARTIKAALAPARIGFDGAAQVARLRRTVTARGKKTIEVVYLITSDRGADPATLAAWGPRAHPAQVASTLAIRPYDLRHAYVSTWLKAGVEPKRVAEWAGHSVDVLLRIYTHCLDGGEHEARLASSGTRCGLTRQDASSNFGTYFGTITHRGPPSATVSHRGYSSAPPQQVFEEWR